MTHEHQPVIALRHISKTFGGVRALYDVDLTIRRGEVHGLLGENGSGKSTLVKILCGFHVPDGGGELEINGRSVSLPLHAGQFRSLGMSFVHQDLGLVPSLSVVENLLVGDLASQRSWRLSWARERRRAQETFRSFGLKLDPRAMVSDLRATDRAMLAIVRAVEEIRANAADGGSDYGVLVLDEPTVFLPASDRDELLPIVREIAATCASILFVSHDLDEILEITDRVTVLRDGKLRGTIDTAQASNEVLVEMIIGRRLQALAIEREQTGAGQAIVITGLTGRYARDVSLTVNQGEVLGLTGLPGSGFEEIPYYVFGARSAAAGRLVLDGKTYDLHGMSPKRALEAGVALIPADRQRDGSIGSLSLGDNVTVGVLHKYQSRLGLNRRRMRSDARNLLAQFDVRPPDPRLKYQSLSGGNQQKAMLAKWLQAKPSLLLLHEPTQGVDVGARQQIFQLTRKAAADGTAVVWVSTDYEQLGAVCDRVAIFGRGRVARELTGDHLTKERIAEQCYSVAEVRQPSRGGRGSVMSAEPASLARRLRRGRSVGEFVERFALVGAWIAVIVVFSVLRPDTFATSSNFSAILGSQAVLVVLTCALLIPLTAGDYDLSITGVLTLSQMMIGILNAEHGISVYVCILLALLMGAVVGLINGAFVVIFGIDSFIVTLGTGTFLGGVVLWISNSETFAGISSQLTEPVVVDRFLGVPLAFYYGLALVIVLWYFLEYTSLGRQLLFVGRSRAVARLSGLRVGRLRCGAMVASGVIAAAAGVLYAGITGAADPVSGAGFLLPAFAAAFLGATSIVPGRFNPWGSFVAVYFLVTGITGLTLLGIQSSVQDMFYGGALVLAVTFSQIARRREEHESGPPEN